MLQAPTESYTCAHCRSASSKGSDDVSDTPVFPAGEGPARVALVEHPDPVCRMRAAIALQRGGRENAYELAGHTPSGLVQGLMTKPTISAKSKLVRDAEASIPVMSFEVPKGVAPEVVAAKLAELMAGVVGQFYPVVLSQNGFHAASWAFEVLRKMCGAPVTIHRARGFGVTGESAFNAAYFADPVIRASSVVQVASASLAPGSLADTGLDGIQRYDPAQVGGAEVKVAYEVPGKRITRPINQAEINYATAIFQSSIDFSQVWLSRDDLASTGSTKTIGNDISFQSQWGSHDLWDAPSTAGVRCNLTAVGLEVLIHELTHVWQYQNGGGGYAIASLTAQFTAFVTTGSRDGAYRWQQPFGENKPWAEWNPEQQAAAVEDYNRAWRSTVFAQNSTTVRMLQPYIDEVRARRGAQH